MPQKWQTPKTTIKGFAIDVITSNFYACIFQFNSINLNEIILLYCKVNIKIHDTYTYIHSKLAKK